MVEHDLNGTSSIASVHMAYYKSSLANMLPVLHGAQHASCVASFPPLNACFKEQPTQVNASGLSGQTHLLLYLLLLSGSGLLVSEQPSKVNEEDIIMCLTD